MIQGMVMQSVQVNLVLAFIDIINEATSQVIQMI